MDPGPFLRGAAFPATGRVPYPRAKPDDRLPRDTWNMAQVPATVRVEVAGTATAVRIAYRTEVDDAGYHSPGRAFALWEGGEQVDEAPVTHGEGEVVLRRGGGPVSVIYLPEWMKPTVLAVDGVGGSLEPPPDAPRWVAYGDSVLEGWVASSPARAWPAVAARDHGLDVVNMGYAGAARGETVSAEHVAALAADVISLSHGTNCWTRTPHSEAQMVANTDAFLDVIRAAQPTTPIVVVSPIVRPDAEDNANVLGATLADLRAAVESVVGSRIDGGDDRLTLVPGRHIVAEHQLADGIHPDDGGHRALAGVVGPVLLKQVG